MSVIKKSLNERIFDIINSIIMIIFMVTILYPFWNLFVTSVNSPSSGGVNVLSLWPEKFSLFNYKYVLRNPYIWIGYRETIIRVVFGTFLSIVVTSFGAYALSKKNFPNRSFWTLIVIIPMFFSGGLIPSYLWNVKLGLIDNRLVLILPGLVSSFNLIIMRNFFMAIPQELEESAHLDGASSLRVLFSIVIPVSKPLIATIILWIMVGHWNSWFDATIYIRSTSKMPLQVVLRRILLEGTQQLMDINPQSGDNNTVTPDSLKAATVYICMIPIMCIYPFLQKYFVQGVMLGSIKG
ncbi:MAG: carbohydrate ABC transporter permease [Clostridiales bacterium]|nr:carbohydrate ABC transporter permease [Clostridiales bacterium]